MTQERPQQTETMKAWIIETSKALNEPWEARAVVIGTYADATAKRKESDDLFASVIGPLDFTIAVKP